MCHKSDTDHIIDGYNAKENAVLADILYNTSNNKTFRKWVDRVLDFQTPWSENDIIYFRKAIGYSGIKNANLRRALKCAFNAVLERLSYAITPEQTTKGIEYLKFRTFKRNGDMRQAKSNPFGAREANIIKNFSHFEFCGVHNPNGFSGYEFYLPIYKVVARDGSSFEYTTNMGNMEVLS